MKILPFDSTVRRACIKHLPQAISEIPKRSTIVCDELDNESCEWCKAKKYEIDVKRKFQYSNWMGYTALVILILGMSIGAIIEHYSFLSYYDFGVAYDDEIAASEFKSCNVCKDGTCSLFVGKNEEGMQSIEGCNLTREVIFDLNDLCRVNRYD